MMALVIATIMVMAMTVPTMAETSFSGTLDTAVSVTGLEKDDNVRFYQVLSYSQDATGTGGWVKTSDFNTLTDDQINQILGLGDYAPGGNKESQAGISAALAGEIASKITSSTTPSFTEIADVNGTASHSSPAAGLYVALITANTAGTVYNPVFVGADYYTNDPATNTWAVTADLTYQDTSMAKKAVITTTKSAVDENTVDAEADGTAGNYTHNSDTVSAGDVLTYTVNTVIPEFADNYVNAAFDVTDILDAGLQLLNSTESGAASNDNYSVVVKITPTGGTQSTITASDSIAVTVNGEATNVTPFTITASESGYTISFNKYYLLQKVDSNTALEITYKAKVLDSAAPKSVNEVDNTVVVSFSNNPTDSTSRAKEIAKTNHYTFGIDADILGQNVGDWVTTEVVKVGLDAEGNEITTTNTTLHTGQTRVGALAGAKFFLYTDSSCESQYNNSMLASGSYIASDSTGRLNIYNSEGALVQTGIKGLDAGTYYLKETEAPAGYIRAQDPVKIEIIPTFEEKTETITDGNDALYVTVNELKSYKVEINDVETASYTMTNAADGSATSASQGDTVTGKDASGFISATDAQDAASRAGKITNTQGVELPSTGGIGTTLFYTIGAILVIGAAIVLITRRRMGVQ